MDSREHDFEAFLARLRAFVAETQEHPASSPRVKSVSSVSEEVERWWAYCCVRDRREDLLEVLHPIDWRWLKRLPRLRLYLGDLWLMTSQLELAERAFADLVGHRATRTTMLAFRGMRYVEYQREQPQRALEAFEELLARHELHSLPERGLLLELYLKLLMTAGDEQRALERVERSTQACLGLSDESDMEVYHVSAVVCDVGGRRTLADLYFERAVELVRRLRPPWAQAALHTSRAFGHFARGEYEASLAYCDRALACDDASERFIHFARSAVVAKVASLGHLRAWSDAVAYLAELESMPSRWYPEYGALLELLRVASASHLDVPACRLVLRQLSTPSYDGLRLPVPAVVRHLIDHHGVLGRPEVLEDLYALLGVCDPDVAPEAQARAEVLAAAGDWAEPPPETWLRGLWALRPSQERWVHDDAASVQMRALLAALERAWESGRVAAVDVQLEGHWARPACLWGWWASMLKHAADGEVCAPPELWTFWRRAPVSLLERLLPVWGARLDEMPPGPLARRLREHLDWVARWRLDGVRLWDRERALLYVERDCLELGATHKTTAVLDTLIARPAGLSTVKLYELVWEHDYLGPSSDQVVYTTVARLRKRLQERGLDDHAIIRTPQGRYALRAETYCALPGGEAAAVRP